MIHDNITEFFGLPVQDFSQSDDWKGAGIAYRVRIDWESEASVSKLLQELAQNSGADQLRAVVLGHWGGDDPSSSSASSIKTLCELAGQFKSLQAIFVGDIAGEENEISWITQSDIAPLLMAYPKLQVLRARGGNDLEFGPVEHSSLKQLTLEAGGLDRKTVRQVLQSSLPALEHLELWLGTNEYGGSTTIEDLQPLLNGNLFPQLSYLGIRNTDGIDDFVPTIVNSPILNRIRTLDSSLGNLSDVGARSLLELTNNSSLKTLNLSHHYVSDEMGTQLAKLPFEVVLENGQGTADEWHSIYVSE